MLASTGYFLLTCLGIGTVIFVHELGHFLAARAVGIRVEAFSIGFGPRLLGFRRGATDYKLCLIPLGGYVKMAGEDPTRPTTGRPDEFGSKKVWQRTLVISAGVIMNIVFAVVAIPLAFAVGIPFDAPVLGEVVPGSAAWEAGLEPGDRIVSIDDRPIITFEDIRHDVAVGDASVRAVVRRGDKELTKVLSPKEDKELGLRRIGVLPKPSGVRIDRDFIEGSSSEKPNEAKVREAFKAAGIDGETLILGVNGLPPSSAWEELIRAPGAFATFQIEGPDGASRDVPVHWGELVADGDEQNSLGILRLASIKRSDAKLTPLLYGMGVREGDVVLAVGTDSMIGQWTITPNLIARALGEGKDVRAHLSPAFQAPETFQGGVSMTVFRDGQKLTLEAPKLSTRAQRSRLLREITLHAAKEVLVTTEPNTPAAEAGLPEVSQITHAAGRPIEDLGDLSELVKEAEGEVTLTYIVGSKGAPTEVRLTPRKKAPRVTFPVQFTPVPSKEVVKLPAGESLRFGIAYTVRTVQRVLQTLKSIVRGSVSPKNLGGIITIFNVSEHYSKRSLTRGLLFLAVISINLAIINILPIPVLDGGWLVFLIIERIKGTPVSERTMGYAQWAGLIAVLSLIGYVTWNDIVRWIL